MSAHQLATGHPTLLRGRAGGGRHNPIFWALILRHCLEVSQTGAYNSIMVNAIRHPSFLRFLVAATNRPTVRPSAHHREEATRSAVPAVARQYQIHEVLFTKVSIWHQRVLLGGWGAGDAVLHQMSRGLLCLLENVHRGTEIVSPVRGERCASYLRSARM